MRILNLSTYDYGGAGSAVLRIHEVLINLNHTSKVVVFNKKSNDLYSKYLIKNKQKKEWKILKKGMIYNKKAIPSQFIHKDFNTFNKKRQANLHHWGNGGGGSHFHMSAPKQFLKGLRISGIKQRRGGRSFKNAQNAKQTTKLL